MTDPAAFVKKIWDLHGLTGPDVYACASHKDWTTGAWQDKRVSPAGAARWVEKCGLPDLYFAPVLFSKPARMKEYYLPSRVLYADLDEVDPAELGDLRPTLAWASSPGRWQGLWVLNRPIPSLTAFEGLNRRLTYATGADKGGWAASKVLRIPGTVSTKYGRSRAKRFMVKLVGGVGPKYRLEDLMALLPKDVARPKSMKNLFGEIDALPNRKAVLDEWMSRLPMRARQLLRTRHAVVGDDRSAKLWEMYNLLLQAGMRPAEVLVAVQGTVWNKYAGQRREMAQLQREISKAAAKHAEPDEIQRALRANGKNGHKPKGAIERKLEKRKLEKPNKLAFYTYDEFMAKPFPSPEWLVEGFWTKGAYGFCAGEYKSFKTMTLLNLGLSVASDTPFLEDERFPVRAPGRVLYLHEEGREGSIKERMYRIASRKGVHPQVRSNGKPGSTVLGLKGPDIHISSFPGMQLTEAKSQRELVNYLGDEKPVLVILESWYLLASEVNDNNASEVAPVLEWLKTVARNFGISLIVSHHYNKSAVEAGQKRRALDRVAGSVTFNKWWESVILLERSGEEAESTAIIQAHHRDQQGIGKQTMTIAMDMEDEDSYDVTVVDNDTESTADKEREVLKVIEEFTVSNEKGTYALSSEVENRLKPLGWNWQSISDVARKGGYRLGKKSGVHKDGGPRRVFVKL